MSFDYAALAADWEYVCNAVGLDTDATADEVVAAAEQRGYKTGYDQGYEDGDVRGHDRALGADR